MTIEELRKQKAEIDKQIRAQKYEKQFGRVRLTKDTYKKCHRGWDLAIKFSDAHHNGEGDKWRNVISTSDRTAILPYIIQLQADLSMMRKELEVNADEDRAGVCSPVDNNPFNQVRFDRAEAYSAENQKESDKE